MDSLALAATVSSLTGTCLKVAISLYDLASKYPTASRKLTEISAEYASVVASLTQLQSFVLQDTAVIGKIDALLKLYTFINTCRVLFSGLDDKIENSKSGTASSKPWNVWNSRVNLQLGWGEVDMQNSIEGIRGQHGALKVLTELLKISHVIRIERERSLPIPSTFPDEKKQPGSGFPKPGITVNSNSDSALDRDDEPPEYSPYDPSQAPPKAKNSLTNDTTAIFKGFKPKIPHPTPSDRIPPTYVPVSGP
ncbi:hypothetical protein LZ554_005400 [Drepanopeziza brunnea f. sp. 'monogermtubi']|nr:hypothetical protein LZ554_005400 [Drepanopeziza brunnea f. sp. 'monogermtubi']